MAVAPLFYAIGSVYYPGYYLTQRGSQVVLAAEDIDNPFQLWYKDESWRYVEDQKGNPAFALINNGSKAALQADASAPSKVSLFSNYDRSKDTELTTAWTLRQSSQVTNIFSVALERPLNLGTGRSPPTTGVGVAAILGGSNSSAQGWTLQLFDAKPYIIQTQWYNQILVAKPPHTDVKFVSGAGSFTNELTVVAVNQGNKNENQEVWYRVPAGSPLEDSNSSFIIISKMNNKALKGSTKSGDKVILTEFDPLDNNFVWSENRSLTASSAYLAINLANRASLLHWIVPADNEYQNASYNHPLALLQVTTTLSRAQWRFVPFTTSS